LRKGQEYTKEFLEDKCKLLFAPLQGGDKKSNSQVGKGFAEIANYISKCSSKESVKRVFLGPKCFQFSFWRLRFLREMFKAVFNIILFKTAVRFVLAALDCCVWPSAAAYVTNCIDTFCHVLAMSPNNVGHCQTPVHQTQTKVEAWVKHKRILEDALHKANMDITTVISLSFDKSNMHANDKRAPQHPCLFVTSEAHQQANFWSNCAAVGNGGVGPVPIIRVSDMIGFDPDNRFGPAARTEQILDQICMSAFCLGVGLAMVFSLESSSLSHFLQPRKGIPCHEEILKAYLRGIEWAEGDLVIFADCLPNRWVENQQSISCHRVVIFMLPLK